MISSEKSLFHCFTDSFMQTVTRYYDYDNATKLITYSTAVVFYTSNLRSVAVLFLCNAAPAAETMVQALMVQYKQVLPCGKKKY